MSVFVSLYVSVFRGELLGSVLVVAVPFHRPAAEEFIAGVMRCRGGARGVDISSLLAASKKLGDELTSICHCLEDARVWESRPSDHRPGVHKVRWLPSAVRFVDGQVIHAVAALVQACVLVS